MRTCVLLLQITLMTALPCSILVADSTKSKEAAAKTQISRSSLVQPILYRPERDTFSVKHPIFRPGVDRFEIRHPIYRPGIDRFRTHDLGSRLDASPRPTVLLNQKQSSMLSTSNMYEQTLKVKHAVSSCAVVLKNERGNPGCARTEQRSSP